MLGMTGLLGSLWMSAPVKCDAPDHWQFLFQDPATPVCTGVMNLHHDIMFIIFFILSFVIWMLFRTVYLFDHTRNHTPSKETHGTALEIVWTVTPSIILMVIAIPSFALLYSLEEVIDPAITLKVIGHQWYWSYEYSDYTNAAGESLEFDSYMVPTDELTPGQLRLLEVDNRVVLPVNTHVRLLVTASDVIHAWCVPSLGVKLDCVPGRLNQAGVYIQRPGTFYGQCSEICGVNHAFMPIVVEAVSMKEYVNWVSEQQSA